MYKFDSKLEMQKILLFAFINNTSAKLMVLTNSFVRLLNSAAVALMQLV